LASKILVALANFYYVPQNSRQQLDSLEKAISIRSYCQLLRFFHVSCDLGTWDKFIKFAQLD